MKKLLFSLLLACAAATGFSQAAGIEITNRTDCDVYLRIRGSKDCACNDDYYSNVLMIPAGTSVSYSNTLTLGGTFPPASPVFVHSANIFSGSRECQGLVSWLVGENSATFPPSSCNFPPQALFYAMNKDCRVVCERLTARWVNADYACRGIARLQIMP